MHLARFPRRRYTPHPTPLEPMPRLSEALGGPELWIKRDDLTGLAGGGNKTRKLEFLVADALAHGATMLVTTGAPQSNHCRLTLAAAAKEGLLCRLVIEERVPGTYDRDDVGNALLFELMGVDSVQVVAAGTDLAAAMQRVADEARAEGHQPYVIPGGGSNALGSLGYVACAEESMMQAFDLGVAFDHVVCASGSGGTHAGWVAGLHGMAVDVPLTGISVRAERTAQERKIHDLATATCALAGMRDAPPSSAVVVRDDQVGPGYSLGTPAMARAVQAFARYEAILLDPVYTGKTAAGLIAMIEEGTLQRGTKVLFVHTGGSPALHAYDEQVRDAAAADA